MPDEFRDADETTINAALELLRKSFDTAQVFVTRQESMAYDAKTVAGSYGYGNWYARYGQIHEWVENGGAMAIRGDDETGECDEPT